MFNRSTLLTLGVLCVLAGLSVPLVLEFADAKPTLEFTELYPFEEHGQWGYLDANGRVVVEPQFDHADYFHGLGLVEVHGNAGYVDDTGQLVIPATYRLDPDVENDIAARPFWDGLAAVRVNGAWGFINHQGDWAIPPKFKGDDGFNTVGDFSGGLAWFRDSARSEDTKESYDVYGFMDSMGNVIIEPQFIAVNDFGEGLAGAVQHGMWGFIDVHGKMTIRPQFDGVGVFGNGLAPAKKDQDWGYIDRRGDWVLTPEYLEAGNFLAGLAPVRTADGWGYIDTLGTWVIRPRYDEAWPFEQGVARVVVDGKMLYVNRSGEQVWPAQRLRVPQD